MKEEEVLSVFVYAYRPLHPVSPSDGGFTVNLYNNNTLVHCLYDTNQNILRMDTFRLGDDVVPYCLNMFRYAAPWLRGVPNLITNSADCRYEYTFGFNGQPLFRIEDLETQVARDFRTIRGHYSRLVYALMEDVSSVLEKYGIDLCPNACRWTR